MTTPPYSPPVPDWFLSDDPHVGAPEVGPVSTNAFPFDTYNVEYGNEDGHGFDLRASRNGQELVGEAFNVAPSFFQLKKTSMLKKLWAPEVAAEFKLLMFNEDAVPPGYKPSPKRAEFFVFVKVGDEGSYMVPSASTR